VAKPWPSHARARCCSAEADPGNQDKRQSRQHLTSCRMGPRAGSAPCQYGASFGLPDTCSAISAPPTVKGGTRQAEPPIGPTKLVHPGHHKRAEPKSAAKRIMPIRVRDGRQCRASATGAMAAGRRAICHRPVDYALQSELRRCKRRDIASGGQRPGVRDLVVEESRQHHSAVPAGRPACPSRPAPA